MTDSEKAMWAKLKTKNEKHMTMEQLNNHAIRIIKQWKNDNKS